MDPGGPREKPLLGGSQVSWGSRALGVTTVGGDGLKAEGHAVQLQSHPASRPHSTWGLAWLPWEWTEPSSPQAQVTVREQEPLWAGSTEVSLPFQTLTVSTSPGNASPAGRAGGGVENGAGSQCCSVVEH